MIFIIGKTASGKDTIVKKLVEKYGYKKMISYTTRPMRQNEKQDVDYHFIDKEDFLNKVENNFFMEYKKFETAFGDWWYGSSETDYLNAGKDTIKIIEPNGLQDILYKIKKNKLNITPICIYIYANNKTIKKRLMQRGDDKKEAKRRLERDNKDFKGVVDIVDRIFYNNECDEVEKIVDDINEYIQYLLD